MNNIIENGPYDAIIVGSGLAGLTSAALLSKAGKKVIVLERHSLLGGCAQSFSRDQTLFDSCIHVVGGAQSMEGQNPGIISKIFNLFNIDTSKLFTELDPVLSLYFPGFQLSLPSGIENLISTLSNVSPSDKDGIRKLFDLILKCKNSLRKYPLYPNVFDNLKLVMSYPFLIKYRKANLNDVLTAHIKCSQLRAILAATTFYMGTPPSRASFIHWAFVIASFFEERSFYCNNTFQNMANTLIEIISKNNGYVCANTEVVKIKTVNNSVKSVTLKNGVEIQSPLVISNLDPLTTFEKLVTENVNKSYINKIDSLTPSMAAFSVFINTDKKVPESICTNQSIYFDKLDIDKCYDEINNNKICAFYLMIPPTPSSMNLSFKKQGTIVTLAPFHSKEYWKENKQKFADNLFKKVESIFTNFDNYNIVGSSSPHTYHRYTGTINGAMVGWELTPKQSNLNRPGPLTPIKGLYLAGQWSRPGGGVSGVCSSASLTVQSILGYKNLKDMFTDLGK